jgi:hypothetical protein
VQASDEIEAITQQELTMKAAPLNSTWSTFSPIDATPYLEAWQANRANQNIHFHLHQRAGPPEDGQTKYINQLQRGNDSDSMWRRNQSANRWSRSAAGMSTSDISGRLTNPPRPQTAPLTINTPLWPNTLYLAQQQGIRLQQPATPHIPKKRGPYKKKDGKEGLDSTPPPNRVVGRGGMVFLSSSRQAQYGTELQKRVEAATVDTGLVTPSPQQQKPLPLALTERAVETPAIERHVSAKAKVEATQQPLLAPPATAVSETVAVSTVESDVGFDGNVASAAILPPYSYQVFLTQTPGRVPLFEKTGAGEKQA